MSSFNRRRFGQILAGAAALPLAAAAVRTAPAADDKGAGADAAAPLTAQQMEQYRKALPDQAKELDKLHSFDLGYGYEPDFVFRAVGANQRHRGAAHAAARSRREKKVKNG